MLSPLEISVKRAGKNRHRGGGVTQRTEQDTVATMSSREEKPQPFVPTPERVRALGSILVGIGISAMAMPLAITWQVVVMAVAIIGGFTYIFKHPYRRLVKLAVESRGGVYKTTAQQFMPLFPLWLVLMILPVFHITSWPIAFVIMAIVTGYMWFMFPIIDATRDAENMVPGA